TALHVTRDLPCRIALTFPFRHHNLPTPERDNYKTERGTVAISRYPIIENGRKPGWGDRKEPEIHRKHQIWLEEQQGTGGGSKHISHVLSDIDNRPNTHSGPVGDALKMPKGSGAEKQNHDAPAQRLCRHYYAHILCFCDWGPEIFTPALPGWFDRMQAKRGETLDEFLKSTVEPTKAETTEKRQEIDKFVRAFQERFKTHKPFTVAQVLKGGSLAKGTAIKGSADIDLVVFFNGLPTVDDLKRELPNLLQIIQDEVKDHSEWKGRVKQVKVTPYSVTFTLDGQKVDILPASEAIRRDLKSPTKIYSTIESSRDGARKAARHYSTSLAPLQVEFVKKVPGSLKGVIRLLKYWKQENNVNIRSYSLELLAIHVSQEYSTLKSTNDLFRECMRLLADPSNIQIAFGQHYDSHKYTR
ncbi:hypothetical protein BaRGS_00030374, partial [Batillaria attramentaria]